MTEQIVYNAKISDAYDFIIYANHVSVRGNDTLYQTIIDNIMNVIQKNLNENGSLYIEANYIVGNNQLTVKLFEMLTKIFENRAKNISEKGVDDQILFQLNDLLSVLEREMTKNQFK